MVWFLCYRDHAGLVGPGNGVYQLIKNCIMILITMGVLTSEFTDIGASLISQPTPTRIDKRMLVEDKSAKREITH